MNAVGFAESLSAVGAEPVSRGVVTHPSFRRLAQDVLDPAWVFELGSGDKTWEAARAVRVRAEEVDEVVCVGAGSVIDTTRFALHADVLSAAPDRRGVYTPVAARPAKASLRLVPAGISGAETGRNAVVAGFGGRYFVETTASPILYARNILDAMPPRFWRASVHNCISKALDGYLLGPAREAPGMALAARLVEAIEAPAAGWDRLDMASLGTSVQEHGGVGLIHAVCHFVRLAFGLPQGEVHQALRGPVFDWACRELGLDPGVWEESAHPSSVAGLPDGFRINAQELYWWIQGDRLCDTGELAIELELVTDLADHLNRELETHGST